MTEQEARTRIAQEDLDDDLYLWLNLGVPQTRWAKNTVYNRIMDRRDAKTTMDRPGD